MATAVMGMRDRGMMEDGIEEGMREGMEEAMEERKLKPKEELATLGIGEEVGVGIMVVVRAVVVIVGVVFGILVVVVGCAHTRLVFLVVSMCVRRSDYVLVSVKCVGRNKCLSSLITGRRYRVGTKKLRERLLGLCWVGGSPERGG